MILEIIIGVIFQCIAYTVLYKFAYKKGRNKGIQESFERVIEIHNEYDKMKDSYNKELHKIIFVKKEKEKT